MKKNIRKFPRNIFTLLRVLLAFATLTTFMVLFPFMSFCETVTDLSCFISTSAFRSGDGQSTNLWYEVRGREPAMIFVVILVGFLAKVVFSGVRRNGRFV